MTSHLQSLTFCNYILKHIIFILWFLLLFYLYCMYTSKRSFFSFDNTSRDINHLCYSITMRKARKKNIMFLFYWWYIHSSSRYYNRKIIHVIFVIIPSRAILSNIHTLAPKCHGENGLRFFLFFFCQDAHDNWHFFFLILSNTMLMQSRIISL